MTADGRLHNHLHNNRHHHHHHNHHHHHYCSKENIVRVLLIGAIAGTALFQVLLSVPTLETNGIIGNTSASKEDDDAFAPALRHLQNLQHFSMAAFQQPGKSVLNSRKKQPSSSIFKGVVPLVETDESESLRKSFPEEAFQDQEPTRMMDMDVESDPAFSIETDGSGDSNELELSTGSALAAEGSDEDPAEASNNNHHDSNSNMANNHQESPSSTSTEKKQSVIPPIAHEAIFVDLPPPPTLDSDDFVSACLLIKDDNHWLIEWLAYHYHALPLRELVVVVDPDSKTSPNKIFHRWVSRNMMNITIWNDKDFMPDKIKADPAVFDNNTALMMHRVRQTNFIKRCIPALRKNNAKWVMLIDTDEFVLPSYTSWYFLNLTQKVGRYQPGNVLKLLKYHEQVTHTNHTCVYMPRYFFGAKESPPQKLYPWIPTRLGIPPKQFITQRFIYREAMANPNGKNLVNMRRIPKIEQFESVHKITSVCPGVNEMWGLNHNHHSIIRVHHYLGTKEQHFFRDDPRTHQKTETTTDKKNKTENMEKPAAYIVRGLQRYDKLNAAAVYEDQGMLGWVPGFVDHVGLETAKALLEGVGVVGIE